MAFVSKFHYFIEKNRKHDPEYYLGYLLVYNILFISISNFMLVTKTFEKC